MDPVTLFMAAQAERQIEQKLAAAAREQELMVRILEDQGWPQVMTNKARLRTDQAADDSEQGAFAAAITANEHP